MHVFREYLSSVIARLPESNEDYRAIQEQMEAIFQQYPKVLEAVDIETAAELSQQECAALSKGMKLRNNLTDMLKCRQVISVAAMMALGI